MAHPLHEIEHRWGERFPINLPVQLSVRAVNGIDGRLKNVSLSGALIEADIALRLNSLVAIKLRLPGPPHREAFLQAHVTRRSDADVGIEWCEFAPAAVKDLLRSLAAAR
jgi:hypothetical protein